VGALNREVKQPILEQKEIPCIKGVSVEKQNYVQNMKIFFDMFGSVKPKFYTYVANLFLVISSCGDQNLIVQIRTILWVYLKHAFDYFEFLR